MTGAEAIEALRLPDVSRVGRRVPKALLLEHGAITPADRRAIERGIDELLWVAALKPTTVGVASFRDDVREYLEVAVLQLTLRAGAGLPRLVELVHRAVPNPVMVLTELGGSGNLSLAHKRRSLAEAGKMVLDGEVVSVELPHSSEVFGADLAAALVLDQQPGMSLFTIYQGWIDAALALAAARLTGTYTIASAPEARVVRMEGLRECIRLGAEVSRLQKTAAREKQMMRRIELNMELKRIEARHANLLTRL